MRFKKGERNAQNVAVVKEENCSSESSKRPFAMTGGTWGLKLITVGVIVCIAACVLTFVFSSTLFQKSSEKVVNRASFPLLYTKEDGLYIKRGAKKAKQISEFVSHNKSAVKATESANGQYVYFLENYEEKTNTGALFVLAKKADKTMISYNVSPAICMNKKGNSAAFLKDYSVENRTGTLSLYTPADKLIKVDTEVGDNEYTFSENGKYLLYLKTTSLNQKDLILYDGHEKVYIDHDVKQIISVSNDMEVLYYKNVSTATNNCELYFWSQENGMTKVADDVYMGYLEKSADLSTIAFLTGKTEQRVFTLNLFSQKTGRLIVDTNVSSVFKSDVIHKRFLYTKNKNEKNAMGELYVKWGGKNPQKITDAVYNQNQVLCSDDFQTVAYLEEYDNEDKSGVLCRQTIKKGEPQEKENIDKTVGEFLLSKDGSVCAYLKSVDKKQNGDLYYYKEGKRIHVDNGVQNYNFKLVDNNRIYYLKNYSIERSGGDLYAVDFEKQMVTKKLDENVWNSFYFRGDDSILYFKNYNETTQRGELMFYRKKQPERVDVGVSNLLFEYSKKY